MADIAQKYQDESLFEACENLYNNIINKRMYITGGIGSSGVMERFTTDYDLPNDTNYSESCASIGLALFCRRMAQITGDSKYIDTMELALMNTVLAGIAMDGKSFFYVNPLEVWPDNCIPATDKNHVKPVRQKWFGCACCPPNIARTLSSLGEYLFMQSDDGLFINMFAGGEYKTTALGGFKKLDIHTKFPFDGKISISISDIPDAVVTTENSEANKKLYIRIPSYAHNFTIKINGSDITDYRTENGYAVLSKADIASAWRGTDIEINFEMPAHFVYANPKVRAKMQARQPSKKVLLFTVQNR